MGFKRVDFMDIFEIIHRWYSGQKINHIAQNCDYDRKTVRKYILIANEIGISKDKPLPAKDELLTLLDPFLLNENQRPSPAQSLLKPHLQEVVDLINDPHNALKPKIAFEVICEKHNLDGKVSYSSFKRFAKVNDIIINPSKATCRIEVPPGSETQIDYGYMGLLYDPIADRRRKVYAFISTLSHSRHKYVEFVYKQNQQSFVASHVKMFEYFGGVTLRIVIDNLKTGIIKPDLYDPSINRTYREMAEHYDCFIDPCRVTHPKDKGKVENQVPVVRQQFRKQLALNPNLDIAVANQLVRQWCLGKHGYRAHGTTGWQPYPTFLRNERPKLKPLPEYSFEIATWKQCTVHPDHYIQFNKKAYSAPNAYIGKKLWVKGTDRIVQLYYKSRLITQHVITDHYRHTNWDHFPENMRKVLDEGLPAYLQKQAGKLGPRFSELIRNVLKPHAFINLRKAQGLVNLKKRYNHDLLEQAASITLDQHLSVTPKSFIRLLEKLKQQNQQEKQIPVSVFTSEFIRPMNYFNRQQ